MGTNEKERIKKWQSHDFYEVLGISPSASSSEVKKGFRKVALTCHPDKVPEQERERATKRFQLIAEAYEVLADDSTRRKYDAVRPRAAGGKRATAAWEPPVDFSAWKPAARETQAHRNAGRDRGYTFGDRGYDFGYEPRKDASKQERDAPKPAPRRDPVNLLKCTLCREDQDAKGMRTCPKCKHTLCRNCNRSFFCCSIPKEEPAPQKQASKSSPAPQEKPRPAEPAAAPAPKPAPAPSPEPARPAKPTYGGGYPAAGARERNADASGDAGDNGGLPRWFTDRSRPVQEEQDEVWVRPGANPRTPHWEAQQNARASREAPRPNAPAPREEVRQRERQERQKQQQEVGVVNDDEGEEALNHLDMLLAMGFDEKQARAALLRCSSVEAAVEYMMREAAGESAAPEPAPARDYDPAPAAGGWKPAAARKGRGAQGAEAERGAASDSRADQGGGVYDMMGRLGENLQPAAANLYDNGVGLYGAVANGLYGNVIQPVANRLYGAEAPESRRPDQSGSESKRPDQSGSEVWRPEQAPAPTPQPAQNPAGADLVKALMEFGFSEKQALAASKRCSSVEAAVEWISSHPEA